MGRVGVNHTPAAAAPPSSPLTHFTHPHDLQPISHYNPQTLICTGCKLRSSGIMYTCQPCNFTLHQSCAKLPHLITHPSHGGCILSLVVSASYPGGVFSCDACGRGGDGWSYHCARCEYDLHVTCAVKPMKIRHASHTTCHLDLTFKIPYVNSDGFSCDACGKMGSKQWLYRCNSCEFDVHLDCTATVAPLQHQRSMPAPVAAPLIHHHHQLMHSSSSGGLNAPPQRPAPMPPYLMHSVSAGGVNQYPGPMNAGQMYGGFPGNQPARSSGGFGSNMMMAAMQGLVEGAAQGVGQAVVQEVIGGGGGGGGGGCDFGDGGGDASLY